MTSPRVLQLSTVHPWDDNRICRKICASLAEAGYDVTLMAREPNSSESEPPAGVELVVLPSAKGRIRRGLSSLGIWRRARRLRPDAVHFHDPELIPAALILKLLGYRVIYDVHEHVPDDIMEKHWIPAPLRRLVSIVSDAIERTASTRFDAIFAVTTHISNRFPKDRTHLLRNFPRLAEVGGQARSPHTETSEGGRLIFVGGITPQRGIREMVTAVGLCDREDPRLDILGECADETLSTWLAKQVSSERIALHGWVEKSESARLMRGSRAGLLPYLPSPAHIEALPTKLFEYMAAGIPVIASDFPRWREIVDGYRCGIMADPTDSHAIASAIDWIYENPTEASAMGARGRQAIESELNWESEAETMKSVYAGLLS
jgi:glycosyltransferase involved in cell wall biosynthesis